MSGGCGSGVCLEGAVAAGIAELRSLPSLYYPPARALPVLQLGELSGARFLFVARSLFLFQEHIFFQLLYIYIYY
jgi:hypothetical protein